MKKIYAVYHSYLVDRGSASDMIAVFENESDARIFANKYYNAHIYDKKSNLCCGVLSVRTYKMFESLKETPEFKWVDFDGFCADELVPADTEILE